MAYEPGENYIGLKAEEYAALQEFQNGALNSFLASNFTPVNGGAFYIFNGDEWAFYQTLDQYDVDPGIYGTYFVYLKSTWAVAPGI